MPGTISLYLHIPFCRRKCRYCDFYSVEADGRVEPFLGALSREVALAAPHDPGEEIATVYVGGGTPSLLSPEQIGRILADLQRRWPIQEDAEISLEANPGTLTDESLAGFRRLGVNRLSLGVQSFQDPLLGALGRIHDRAEAIRAVELARAAGFTDLSLDLIYAIPGQTMAQWEADLRTAIGLAPEHLSAYSLTIEQRTPLGRMVAAGATRPAPPEIEAAMLERTMERLAAAGYEHYEVSNYARPGFRCRHNQAYWSHADYLGFGPSAHSFRREDGWRRARRWWNVSDLGVYCARLEREDPPLEAEEALGRQELLAERIFLGLRRGELDLASLERIFGWIPDGTHGGILGQLELEGLATRAEGLLRLTPRGFLLCDEIARRLLS
ncbi:MAG: radical SAM family heme chaperone HemW [Candidatus Methylomirabilota bacterium]